MVIFNSYVKLPEGRWDIYGRLITADVCSETSVEVCSWENHGLNGKFLYKLVVYSWEHFEQSEESEKSTLLLT